MQLNNRNNPFAYDVFQLYLLSLDWLFPPQCAGCQTSDFHWCPTCESQSTTIRPPQCAICGISIRKVGLCRYCYETPPNYSQAVSWGVYRGQLRNAILRLKQHRDIALGSRMAELLIKLGKEQDWKIDLVTAVPLSKKRLRERGFNQSELLARPYAWGRRVNFHTRALVKIKNTRSQIGLTRIERRENVTGAFVANQRLVQAKSILLVDDVMTTGATLEACTHALLDAGAAEVYALTVARAMDPAFHR